MARIVNERKNEQIRTVTSAHPEQQKKQRLSQKDLPSRRRLDFAQSRSLERYNVKIRFRLQKEGKEVVGYSQNISPGGLQVISTIVLNAGTPLAIQCSFGEVGYLNVSGQVVYCRADIHDNHTIGIKFSALRDWEEKILTSAVQELNQSPATQEKSLLTMLVSEDTMALEAADFYVQGRAASVGRPGTIRQSCVHAAKIVGWGSYLPPHEISNQNINSMLRMKGNKTRFGDVVGSLTGIKSRRYAGSKVYPSDLAVEASLRALRDARVDPKDIEVIISCGVARDVEEPATAFIIQEKLGARNAYVFDLANACNGFISAIDVLDSFIASGRCEIGLVAVGDILSQYVTWDASSKKDLHMSSMSYTFGDGGGAAVLQRIKEGDDQGIRARWFLSDSSYWRVAVIPLMDTPRRLFKSNASEIERAALEHVPIGVEKVMEMLDWDLSDIELIIPHQVSSHINENLFYKKLGWPREKVFWSFPGHGNVGAASMPVALCEARRKGRLKAGDKVLLVGGSGGFGAGVIGLVM
jgi:3-oxoacyl-[acyl-carrier-protein] synthase-3